jgi:hypothetical protein
MQILFGASLLVQLVLASHAYRHGRLSPWVWLILFFPVVGSLLYVVLFLLPDVRPANRRPAPEELRLRRVARGPFASKGDRPDTAISVSSPAEIEPCVSREECPECGAELTVEDHRAETIVGRRLRVVVTSCRRCDATPVRYFEIRPVLS